MMLQNLPESTSDRFRAPCETILSLSVQPSKRAETAALCRQHNLKLKVPEDVSVIGFANSLIAELSIAPLCSVAQPFNKMGKAALRLLLDQPCDLTPAADGRYLLPNELIIRKSG